jgi:hypothetical protein
LTKKKYNFENYSKLNASQIKKIYIESKSIDILERLKDYKKVNNHLLIYYNELTSFKDYIVSNKFYIPNDLFK